MIKEDSSDSLRNRSVCHHALFFGIKIKPPIFEFWNHDKTIVFGNNLIQISWECLSKLLLHNALDSIDDLSFESSLEHIDETIPEAAMGFE